jgi:hypothetical protein
MLEHVTVNQTRFVAPGLRPDPRGVALGRFCLVLAPTIDRVVGLFRGLSEEVSLDELLRSLRIVQVRTPLGSREFAVCMPVTNSYAADSVAGVASLVGGQTFTGSAKHFVRYRDARSPLGYDVDVLQPGEGDFFLYSTDFVQNYYEEREVSFPRLVYSLSLQREPEGTLRQEETLLLRVAQGLWPAVLGYLHRNGLRCGAAAGEEEQSPTRGSRRPFFLLRCSDLPQRMVRLFRVTPGIEVYRFETPQVALQLGYRHPIQLTSCASVFDGSKLYLFSGERNTLQTIPAPSFVPSASVIDLEHDRPMEPVSALEATLDPIRLPLRLVQTAGPRPQVVASRIPQAQGKWLKKLVYLLPPKVLNDYEICQAGGDYYLLGEEGVDFVPLGEMFYSVATGVYVTVGYRLLPRVHGVTLMRHLGTDRNQVVFFRQPALGPIRFDRTAFAPLAPAVLAGVEVDEPPASVAEAAPEEAQVTLRNEDLGAFPLWGFDHRPRRGRGH